MRTQKRKMKNLRAGLALLLVLLLAFGGVITVLAANPNDKAFENANDNAAFKQGGENKNQDIDGDNGQEVDQQKEDSEFETEDSSLNSEDNGEKPLSSQSLDNQENNLQNGCPSPTPSLGSSLPSSYFTSDINYSGLGAQDIKPDKLPNLDQCNQIGYLKIDGNENFVVTGTYKLGDAKTNGTNDGFEVDITNVSGETFSWESNYPVYYVYAKGGNEGGNLYTYSPAYCGTSLSQPGGGWSHIVFYYCTGETPPPPPPEESKKLIVKKVVLDEENNDAIITDDETEFEFSITSDALVLSEVSENGFYKEYTVEVGAGTEVTDLPLVDYTDYLLEEINLDTEVYKLDGYLIAEEYDEDDTLLSGPVSFEFDGVTEKTIIIVNRKLKDTPPPPPPPQDPKKLIVKKVVLDEANDDAIITDDETEFEFSITSDVLVPAEVSENGFYKEYTVEVGDGTDVTDLHIVDYTDYLLEEINLDTEVYKLDGYLIAEEYDEDDTLLSGPVSFEFDGVTEKTIIIVNRKLKDTPPPPPPRNPDSRRDPDPEPRRDPETDNFIEVQITPPQAAPMPENVPVFVEVPVLTEVPRAAPPSLPKTGDPNPWIMVITGLGVSISGLAMKKKQVKASTSVTTLFKD